MSVANSPGRNRTHRRTCVVPLAMVVAVVLLAGCGSRLDHEVVLAQNQAVVADSGGAGTSVGNTPVTGDITTGVPVAGGPAAVAPGAVTPGASAGTTGTTKGGKPRSSTGAAGAGAAGASAGTKAPNGPATLSPVAIGQIATNSGVVGSILGQAVVGARIWTQWINQHGGLNGHRVNLITADDGGDPSKALAAVKRMVERDKVIAFIANANLLTAGTIAPYLQEKQVPSIGGDLQSAEWHNNPNFYPHGPGVRVQQAGAAELAIQSGKKKFAMISCVEVAIICSAVKKELLKDIPALGGEVVYSVDASIAQPDYTTECLGAKNAGADAFMILMDPNSLKRIAASCGTQNFRPVFPTNGLEAVPAAISPDTAGKMLMAPAVFPFMVDTPATADFRQAVKDALGTPPTAQFHASAWLAGLVLQKAASNLSATHPTSADIIKGLGLIKNDTFGGLSVAISFVPNKITPSSPCFFRMELGQSEFVAPVGLKTSCVPAALTAQS